jgi:SPW repeat-containing protein
MRRRFAVALDPERSLPLAAAGVVTAALAAPWALGFAGRAAVAGHVAFAMTVGPIALLAVALPAAAYATGVAGAWLAVSPWLLGYASAGATAWSADLAAGLALVAISRLAVRHGS